MEFRLVDACGRCYTLALPEPDVYQGASAMTTTISKGLLLAIAAFTAMTAGCQTKPAPAESAAPGTPCWR